MPASTKAKDRPGKIARRNRRGAVKIVEGVAGRGGGIPPAPPGGGMDGAAPPKRIGSRVLRSNRPAEGQLRSGRCEIHKPGRSFRVLPFQLCTRGKCARRSLHF